MTLQCVWAIWSGLALVSFGALEAYALLSGQETLSHFIYTLTYRSPAITFVILAFLAVHFAIIYLTHGRA